VRPDCRENTRQETHQETDHHALPRWSSTLHSPSHLIFTVSLLLHSLSHLIFTVPPLLHSLSHLIFTVSPRYIHCLTSYSLSHLIFTVSPLLYSLPHLLYSPFLLVIKGSLIEARDLICSITHNKAKQEVQGKKIYTFYEDLAWIQISERTMQSNNYKYPPLHQ
jgi:hypothetical protein